MRKSEPLFRPLSLAQHFEAPDDFTGCFGWICGYSADLGFLDDAVERFTRRMHAQRAYDGRSVLAMLLDPSNPQIAPKDVPGVLHLALRGVPPFRLLHAKVAILGFRHTSDVRQWRVRLLVSTGNWTRQTLEESLDLVWRIDLGEQDLRSADEQVLQDCADLGAAWKMMNWLRGHFDLRVLQANIPGRLAVTSEADLMEKWIVAVAKRGVGYEPRFFDNRGASLLARMPDLVRTHASASARNYLAMGSGFFESPDGSGVIPPVLSRIVDTLRDSQLLVRKPEVDVFVNPEACQAMAGSVVACNEMGWSVREAGKPDYFKTQRRALHAKFIFSANHRENSDFCNSAWLYLGSGNLTGPGFAHPMASRTGNLEAGVMIRPESLQWRSTKGIPPESVVTNLLPLQWDTDFNQRPEALTQGADMPDPEVLYRAPPVAFFFWTAEEDANWLRTADETSEQFDVLNDAGTSCPRASDGGFPWPGPRPRQVEIRWGAGEKIQRVWVPVIDEFGRIAATILPRIDLAEAWNQLADFPMPPDEAELLADAEAESATDAGHLRTGSAITASYPVREMMQLLENVAAKQTSVSKLDWVSWCTRLEQILSQASDSPVLAEFLKLGINPLGALWHPAFRPDFAADGETGEGRRYEAALECVEKVWNVADLKKLGDTAR